MSDYRNQPRRREYNDRPETGSNRDRYVVPKYTGNNSSPYLRHKRRRKNRKIRIGILDIAFGAGIVLFLVLLISQSVQSKQVDKLKASMAVTTAAPQTAVTQMPEIQTETTEAPAEATAAPIGVSDATLDSAITLWETNVESQYSGCQVTLDNGETLVASDYGYESNYETALSQAWSAGKLGVLSDRLTESGEETLENEYGVTRTLYDEEQLGAYLEKLAEEVYKAPVSAKLEGFDSENFKYVITPSEDGVKLDIEATKAAICAAFENGGGEAQIVTSVVSPKVTTESLKSQYGCIGYCETDCSTSKAERINNIKLALSILNGTSVLPGYAFSFNNTIGKRTEERGFLMAGAYSDGTLTQQVGGGICQVSSTLFNAAMNADMNIIERHSHSKTVSYIDNGLDATVNWDTADLKFRNSSDEKIYIAAYLTDSKKVRIGIFGKKPTNNQTVKLVAVYKEAIPFETYYKTTSKVSTGSQKVAQEGKDGAVYETYKVYYNEDGDIVSKTLLCISRYSATDEYIWVGA